MSRDPVRAAAYCKAYRETHREERRLAAQAWKAKHPERLAEYERRRHERRAARPVLSAEARFWRSVQRNGQCWVWTRSTTHQGYGHFWLDGHMLRAHRYSWELENGPIPPGMHVLHHCDNPPCVRPAHLWLGTNAENMADRNRKGRTAAGDRNGRHGSRRVA